MLRRTALPFVPAVAICAALVCLAVVTTERETPSPERSGYIVASS